MFRGKYTTIWCLKQEKNINIQEIKKNKLSDKILLLKEYHNIDFSFFPSFELLELNNRLLPLSDFYLSASEMHRVVWVGYKLSFEVYIHFVMNEIPVIPVTCSLLSEGLEYDPGDKEIQ